MSEFKFKDLGAEKNAEIEEARSATHTTCRVTVPALEEIMYRPIAVLDHGSLSVLNYMGDDSTIVSNARVSYGKGTKKVSEDATLIEYLLRHRHTTPFEGCEIQFRCHMPIFVARQWIRHRTANVNEYSARYSILSNEFYVPEVENLLAQSQNNKQGRAGAPIVEAGDVRSMIRMHGEISYLMYQWLLNSEEMPDEKVQWGSINKSTNYGEMMQDSFEEFFERRANKEYAGIARELARMVMPVNGYTTWTWKIDLHNLLHFLSLRNDPHAQYEIRVYAEQMWKVVQTWVPAAAAAFQNVRMDGISLTGRQLRVLQLAMTRDMSNDQSFTFAGAIERIDYEWAKEAIPGLGKREFEEMKTAVTKGL